jgi:predicted nucleotidyltransferase
MISENIIQALKKELPYLREKYGVERIAVFGSQVKGTSTKESDVDILVELTKPLGLEFVNLAYYLEEVLGKKVDLTTFATLRQNRENPRYKHIATDIERTLSYV